MLKKKKKTKRPPKTANNRCLGPSFEGSKTKNHNRLRPSLGARRLPTLGPKKLLCSWLQRQVIQNGYVYKITLGGSEFLGEHLSFYQETPREFLFFCFTFFHAASYLFLFGQACVMCELQGFQNRQNRRQRISGEQKNKRVNQ